MLKKITIKNFALIKSLELDFSSGLCIFSGETGAGKSILVDCLTLLLGGKYDKTMLRHGEDKGFVEGVFEGEKVPQALKNNGLDEESQLIVLRKFDLTGRNDIKVNSFSCTSLALQRLMNGLVDIYGQHEYQSLARAIMHQKILDAFLKEKTRPLLEKISKQYSQLLLVKKDIKNIGDAKSRANQLDVIKYQLSEIERAAVQEGEEEELLSRRKIISSGEKIALALGESLASLQSENMGATERVSTAVSAMGSISGYSEAFNLFYERLNSLQVELDDIISTITDERDSLEFQPEELEKIERRLDIIRTIKRKYGDFLECEKFVKRNSQLLDSLENAEEKEAKLLKQKEEILDMLFSSSSQLSSIRQQGAKEFERLILLELSDLGMTGAKFSVQFSHAIQRDNIEKLISYDGADALEFYFSANVGQPIKPLIKVISGGELSRFMLALKTVSSSFDNIPTMIFDEIDAGISGKIGQEVAKKLARISRKTQVLCVTHLPQIAAMADKHFFIDKKTIANETTTAVTLLHHSGEIEEVARLSGSSGISSKATENAKEMKNWSASFKSQL